ncbi:MAG: FlgD immunoglobulin-like domain containing protein [Microcystaceae cyanobacterium]
MKRLIFLLFLTFLLSPSFTYAQNCERGDTRKSDYMLRQDDERCEGLNPDAASNAFGLNSFTIGQLQLTEKLTLAIPKVPNLGEPTIIVKSRQKYYQLIPLELKEDGQQWEFEWSYEVLDNEKISPQTVRGLATVNNTIIPVDFNSSASPIYHIDIYTGGNALEITLIITDPNNNLVYEERLTNQLGEEVNFTWNGRTPSNQPSPQGRYKVRVKATVEQQGAASIDYDVTRQFEHNPQWLN